MHCANGVRRSRVVRLSWFSRFVMQAAVSKMRPSNSPRVSTFLLYTSPFNQRHQQKSMGDPNSSISVTIQNYTDVHMNFFFSQWPILSHPKILTFARKSPCLELGELSPAVAIHSPTAGQDTPSSAEQGSGPRVGLRVFDGRQMPSPLHKTKLWSTK